MPMPRSEGGTSFMRFSPISSSPEVMSSSPAIMRSSVDLPQPDGPTNTTNSPSSMVRLTSLEITASPKAL